MPFHPVHNPKRGIQRLLEAPRDVPVRDPIPWRSPPIRNAAASPAHRALFADYKKHLDGAIRKALAWWDDMVKAAIDRGADPAAAEKEVYHRTFSGPAARGEVIWTLRTYWLKCVAANREVPVEQRVPPQVMLLGWLVDERLDEWVTVLTGLPYWPIGLEDGEWV